MLLLLFKGGGAQSTQSISLSSGISSTQVISLPQGLLSVQGLSLRIADAYRGVQGLKSLISGDPARSVQEAILEISEKDIAQSLQSIRISLDEIGSSLQEVDYNIYLDGRSIKGQITNAVIVYDEGSVHNHITCQSIDRNLFWRANPYVLSGESRIEVHIGARILYFLLEDKRGNEVEFELWGRSISARDDEPHSDDIDFSLSSPMSARTAAESMVVFNALNWEVPDWTLPSDYEFNGSRIEGLQQIASIIGAIVRSEDDGSLTVRRLWPVRPVNMPSSTPVVEYDRFENIIQLTYEVVKGEGFNEVNIFGKAPDLIMPDLVLQESNPCVGDQVTVRAYWKAAPPSIIDTFITSGVIQLVNSSYETVEDTIVFENGIGNCTRPIYDLLYYQWIGSSAGAISFTQYESEFRSQLPYGIAEVTYRTKYQTYRLSGHNVRILLAALIVEGTPGSSVKVKMLDGGKVAPPIENANLTSTPIALEAGQAFLDASKYDKTLLKLRVPYVPEAQDGVIASVVNQDIGISGNFKIQRVQLIFQGPQIVEEVEVSQCQL